MTPDQGKRYGMPYVSGMLVIMAALVSISMADPGCYIDNKLLNKAFGKTTYGSSVTRVSSLTVDGNRADFDSTCMNTGTVGNPWLIVDLHETLPVSTVVFTALTAYQATNQYQVLVGDTFDAATFNPLTSGYELCLSRPVSMVEFEVMYVQCERTLVGRYILIFKQQTSNLCICEVEVYAEQMFQPEKWTCIRPELQGPTGLLNLGRGRGPYSRQISDCCNGQSYKALDGNDDTVYERGWPCSHTGSHSQAWWLVDLGKTIVITGVSITNRQNCCADRLKNFKFFVGNFAATATSFVESDYEVCLHYCTVPSASRKYYTCERCEGNHVAIALSGIVSLCEVEIYSDINDVTFPSWPANHGLNQRALYDDDDGTCIQLHQMLGWRPFSVEIPWDPTTKTGILARSGYYHCRQDFYVNVTYTTGLNVGVSISKEREETASGKYTYIGKFCEVIGTMEDEGLTRMRYACFCEVKCFVFIYVKHPHNMNITDSRLCTINVYD